MAHSFGGLAVSLAFEEISHDDSYRIALIAPATESKTAIDLFFSFLHSNGLIRKEFDELIYAVEQKPADWYSVSRAIKYLRARIRWFHDEDDDITPWKDAQKVKEENYPGVDFVVTKGLGHRKIYKDPAVSAAIIDFL
jgi:pimeloyl-ACP methyl ester carboxylesterase